MRKKFRFLISASIFSLFIITIQIQALNLLQVNDTASATDTVKILKPGNFHSIEEELITSLLSRYHYKKFDLNDSLSKVIFDRYLDALDKGKNYFLSSDIKSFDKDEYNIDNFLLDGQLDFFYNVFNIYLERLNQRVNYINTLLNKEFDYSKKEDFQFDRDKADWAIDQKELDEVWRKRLKNDALTYKLEGKDWSFIQKTLRKRYDNFAKYLNKYNSEDVFQLAMNCFTEAIDPHTNYFSPEASDDFKIDMSLSLEGIGAKLQTDDDYTKIVEVIPGGPAAKSKLLNVDDKIVGVAQGDSDFVDIIGWRVTDAVKLIRGPKGTTVRLQILPAGSKLSAKPIEISLIRDKVKLEEQAAKSSILDINNDGKQFKIGVINVPKFYNDFEGQRNGDGNYKSTTKDVKVLLDSLQDKKVDGIVIDLRNDGGGSLEEAIEMTGLFIDYGPVVQIKNSNGSVDVEDDPDSGTVYKGPLAVLVNRFSASASEIFAAAIQDYGRGLILGEQTYGKGTVQNMIDLNRLATKRGQIFGQVKLTIAKFYRINGGSTQNLGVTPDIKYPTYIDPKEFGESSEPSALPWDEINPTPFKRFSDLSKFIPTLEKKHLARIKNDKDFIYLSEDIKEYNENKKKTYISLNEEIRQKEKNDEDKKKFDRENERKNVHALDTIESEIPKAKNDEKDFLLDESGKILADYIMLKVG